METIFTIGEKVRVRKDKQLGVVVEKQRAEVHCVKMENGEKLYYDLCQLEKYNGAQSSGSKEEKNIETQA